MLISSETAKEKLQVHINTATEILLPAEKAVVVRKPTRDMVNSGCQRVVEAVWTVRSTKSRRENYRVQPVFGKSLGKTGLEESQIAKWFPAMVTEVTLQEGD